MTHIPKHPCWDHPLSFWLFLDHVDHRALNGIYALWWAPERLDIWKLTEFELNHHCSLILHAGPIVTLMWMIVLLKYWGVHHPSLPRFPWWLAWCISWFSWASCPLIIYIYILWRDQSIFENILIQALCASQMSFQRACDSKCWLTCLRVDGFGLSDISANVDLWGSLWQAGGSGHKQPKLFTFQFGSFLASWIHHSIHQVVAH